MTCTIPRGFYHDAFEPGGPVEVLGVGVSIHHNAQFVILRGPGDGSFELVRPAEFNQPVTVKNLDGSGSATIPRFTPVIQDETCHATNQQSG